MRLGIRWGGLRFKLIAGSFVPTAIILTAVALVGFYAYQQVTENLTVASSRELARLSAGELAAELTEYSDTLTALARTAFIYIGDPGVQQGALIEASNRLSIFDGGVLILDNYGRVAATQPVRPEIIGQDWSSRDYFRQMIRAPGAVYSNIVNDGPGGARVIDMAVPITNGHGDFVGALVGMFRVGPTSISSFYGSIARLRIGGNGAAYLVDRSGWVIYHSNTEQIDQNLAWQGVVQRALGGQASALRTRDSAGKEIVASFAPVPGTPWELVIEQNWDVLLASGQSYLQPLFLLLVLGLVTPALVATLGVRRITEPINQLIAATQAVAEGDLRQKITVRTGDELAELGEQFNRMSAQLSESYTALKLREERFALVVQGTNDGIWDWDLKTDDVYYSPRWKAMLGYEDHELANRFETWRNLLHPDDLGPALTELQDYLEGRSSAYRIEVRMRHKDGSYRWISARGGALRDAQGQPCRMAGSHTDITERKQTEEAFRQSEKRFSQVFHASPIAISITAPEDGRYIDANNAWLRLFGYRREEVIDNTSLRLNIWVQPEQESIMIRRLQATGSVRDFGHLARTKSGQVRDVLVSAEVIELSNRRYYLSSVLDVTERKRAEEEIRRQNEYLAALHETALGVISRLDVRELLETIVARAINLVGAADGFVYLVTPDGTEIETTVGTGAHRKHIGQRLARGEGLSGKIWETGQPMAVDEYRTWQGRSSRFDDTPIGPEVGAPLKSGVEVVGIIGLTREVSAPPFAQDEIDLMSRFAQLASIALDNARLHTSMQQELAERVRAEEALQERLTFEKLITDISTQFINLGPDEIDAGIQRALQATAEFTEADRSYVFRFSEDGATMDNTHEWCAQGIESQIATLQAIPVGALPYLTGRIQRLEVFHAPRVADLPPAARAEKDESEREKTQSVICVPMVYRGDAVGFLGFDAVRAEKTWSGDAVTLLTLVGEVFVNALEQKRAQEKLQFAYQTLERRVGERTHELATLNAIAASVNRSLDLKEIMRDALERIMRIIGMEHGIAYRVEGEEGDSTDAQQRRLRVMAYRGYSEEFAHFGDGLPVHESAAGVAGRLGEPMTWSLEELPTRHLLKQMLAREGVQQVISIPLMSKGRFVGALNLSTNRMRAFAPEQITLLKTIGQQVGVAVENARLYEQAERSAQAAERSRLARDLHDSVTQSLYSVTLYAEAAARLLTAGNHAQAAAHLRDLRDTAQGALREMRLLIFELRPPTLEKTGLAAALQARLDAVELRGGMKAEIQVTGREPEHLPPRVQEELYYIAQEALNNALKHSSAQHVQVHLQYLETVTRLEICDDGVGFDPEKAGTTGGLGLAGMQERAERIGGKLWIEKAPGQGTKVGIEVPMSPPRQDLGGTRRNSEE